jgi:hypothetical protein
VNLWAEACNNPAFGHLFIKNFVELRKPLPAAIYATELLRGYRFLRFGHRDPDVQAAFALLHDSEMKRRILVRCMLIRPEYEYSRIAAKAGLSEDAVRIYHALRWAVRGRDKIYIASLIYPHGRQCEFREDYASIESLENLCLRAANWHGIEPVEALLGSTNPFGADEQPLTHFSTNMNMTSKLDQLSEDYLAQVLQNATFLHRIFPNQDLRAFKDAMAAIRLRKSLQARQREDTSAGVASVSAVAVSQSLSRGMSEVERRLSVLARNQARVEANADDGLKHSHSPPIAQPDLLEAAA